ncbi:uncharacterized protein PHACADRAFT_246739 [Phanerochaete carnosa HHB-10118-sp]|uniref:Anaphase-promoting complex subunit 4 WD40 domain-containing protein n=1 Tax=Phanerochaete carnosa (strain HHB-10118-sp) TaxID=650164 RepID=K5VCK8_PHACS|nr:uncharacterized protein PHACADRAFT_246739 [Phanerochaete carnosa HHB-10118-sp]EKM60676.1 hypothetical protein PHACADRAFT_246739 [Phanerochaete carnosa HHB-10118-sp]
MVSDEELEEVGGGQELQNLMDTDLFFVDDAQGAPSDEQPSLDFAKDMGEQSEVSDAEDKEEKSEQENASEQSENDEELVEPEPVASTSTSRKAPAWIDSDDTNISVSLADNARLRKLRDTPSDNVVGGREYERRLRRQFERINPTPDWAQKARSKLHPTRQKRRRLSVSSDEEEKMQEDEALGDLLGDTGGILGPRPKKLAPGTLSIERLRDANLAAPSEGAIKAVQFHPSAQIPVLLTASEDRRLRFFNVDGHTNPHLQTVHIPDLPITTALFHPTGTNVLLTGPRPYFYTYDLQSGSASRSPRGLWGTTFSGDQMKEGSMEICAFNPTGEVLAVAGRKGYVHLVDWRSGTGQVVGSVKMNSVVKGVWWARGGAGAELMSLGEDAEVYVWDVGTRRCTKRWKDEGGFGATTITGDRAGQYLGIGSRHGIVSVYGSDAAPTSDSKRPKPLKTIGNLTTSISSVKFNHDSQLLAIASNTKKDQMRIIHLPSLTAYSNWPTFGTPLGHVTSIDFSTGSEYVAIGNSRGRALLYHLRDFAQQ